ncbi:MAG: response regulator, partial [Ilumatobacteraceae bacterium]
MDDGQTTARCLLVDDESPARDELRFLLSEVPGVTVVGEAATAEEAQALLNSIEYDVVFLDVRMPGMGGLELARALHRQPRSPAVIFTTAYPEHAVTAFELEAVDYLVKPFDGERLRRALDRALAQRPGEEPARDEPLAAMRDHELPGSAREQVPARIPVHKGDRVIL